MTMMSADPTSLRGEVVPHMPFLDFVGQVHPGVQGVLAAAVNAVHALIARGLVAARCRYSRWQTIRALSGLEEHMLRDIGVRRDDLQRVALRVALERERAARMLR